MRRLPRSLILFISMLSLSLFLSSCVMNKSDEHISEDAEAMILYETESCKLSVESIKDQPVFGKVVTFICENRLKDKTLDFEIVQYAQNHCVIDMGFIPSTVVNAESSGTIETHFNPRMLNAYNVEQEELEIWYRISDNNDPNSDAIGEGVFLIQMKGTESDEVSVPSRFEWEHEQVLVDDENACFVLYNAQSMMDSGLNTSTAFYVYSFIENRTDKPLTFVISEVTFDGQNGADDKNYILYPGMRYMMVMLDFDKDFFETSQIDSRTIQEMKFKLEIRDLLNSDNAPYFSQTIHHTPVYPES